MPIGDAYVDLHIDGGGLGREAEAVIRKEVGPVADREGRALGDRLASGLALNLMSTKGRGVINNALSASLGSALKLFKPKPMLLQIAMIGGPQVIASLSAISAQLGTMVGGGLAVLPGMFAASAVAIAPLVLGLSGFGQALKNMGDPKKLAEALKGLAPSAAATVLAVKQVGPAWGEMKKQVQGALFAGIAAQIKPLSDVLLPKLRTTLVTAAGGWSVFGNSILATMRQSAAGPGSTLTGLGDAVARGLRNAAGAVPPLSRALGGLVKFGMQRMTGGWSSELIELSKRFEAFVTRTTTDGSMTRWVENAKSSFKDLMTIIGSIGRIFGGIGKAASQSSGGMTPLAAMLSRIADLVNSPAFQTGLSGFFSAASTGAAALGSALPAVAGAFGALGPVLGSIAQTMGPILAVVLTEISRAVKVLAPALQPVIAALGQGLMLALKGLTPLFRTVVDVIAQLLPALAPLLPAFGTFVGILANLLVPVLKVLTPILVWLANIIAKVLTFIAPVLPYFMLLGAAFVYLTPLGVVLAAAVFGLIKVFPLLKQAIAAVVNWVQTSVWPVMQSVFQWVGDKAIWLYNNAILPAWNGIRTAVGAVVNWFSSSVWPTFQSVLQWVGDKASWLWGVLGGVMSGIRSVVGAVVTWFQTSFWPPLSTVLGYVGGAFKTFAVIVELVFRAFMKAIDLAYSWFRDTAWPIVSTVLGWLGDRFTWLRDNIISPVFNAVKTIIGNVVAWFRDTAWPIVSTVLQWVGGRFSWVYNSMIKPAFDKVKAIINAVVTWFRDTAWPIVLSVVQWIGDRYQWLYNSMVKPAFDKIKSIIGNVVAWFRDTAKPIFTNVMTAIGNAPKKAYDTYIKPAFDTIKSAVGKVADAFTTAKDAIGRAWDAVRGKIKSPIVAVLNIVENGLLGGLRTVASWVGMDSKKIPSMKGFISRVQGLRSGGPVRGHSPNSKADNIPIWATAGEFMHPVQRVKQYGVERMEAVRRGVARIVLPHETMPGFASGGLITLGKKLQSMGWNVSEHPAFGGVRAGHMKGSHHYQGLALDVNWPGESGNNSPSEVRNAPSAIREILKAGWGYLWQSAGHFNHIHVMPNGASGVAQAGKAVFGMSMADILEPAKAIYNKALGGFKDSSGVGQLVLGAVKKMGTSVWSWAGDKVTSMLSRENSNGSAGGNVQRWAPTVLQALKLMNQPASLLQTVLRRMNQESGGNPAAMNNWDSNARRGTPSKGLMQVIDPTFQRYFFPGYGTNIFDPLSNLLASMRYAISRYGSLPAAYNKAGGYARGGLISLLGGQAGRSQGLPLGSYDQGGLLPTGLSLAYNGTGRPEPVGHDLKGTTNNYITVMVDIEKLRQIQSLEEFLEMLENSRVNSRGVARSGTTTS